MLGETTETATGLATVIMTSGRGLNPDELTELAMAKLLTAGPDVGPHIRTQVERVRGLLYFYLAQAQKSQNTTLYNILLEAGETSAAELVRSL